MPGGRVHTNKAVGPDVISDDKFEIAQAEDFTNPDSMYFSYTPHGGAMEILQYQGREAVLHGGSGTGKSLACLNKLYIAATKYRGMRGAIVRKFRSTITQSAMNTFEKLVIVPGDEVKFNSVTQDYRFPNGSSIVVAGLDDPTKILSTEFDIIYVQECTEIDLQTWETLITRIRWSHMPYQQVIGDCNPASQHHWIMRRSQEGKLRLIQSKFQDNPLLWDLEKDDWTKVGREYVLEGLANMTGNMRQRFFEGKWVGLDGLVFPEFDPEINLMDGFKIPSHWTRYLTVDFGFTNPTAIQWWAEDPDGRLYMYRELYGTQTMVQDWAHQIYELSQGEDIQAIICDQDAEDRATLEHHILHSEEDCFRGREKDYQNVPNTRRATSPADKRTGSVRTGIEKVKSRMLKAGDHRPRLVLFKGALVREDASLVNAAKPKCLVEELESYVWDKQIGGKLGDRMLEVPKKQDDHGCDAMRYLVMFVDGNYARDTANVWGMKMKNVYKERTGGSPLDILKGTRKDSFWK